MTGAKVLVAGALAAAVAISVVSCSASSRKVKSQEAMSAAPPEAGPGPADWQITRKEEIRAAWDRIAELRQDPKIGLAREPAGTLAASSSVGDLRQCVAGPEEPEVTAECSDVCNIKDAICDNAEDICRIAEELDGDVWATDKCNSAKTSCKEAKEICCGCISGE